MKTHDRTDQANPGRRWRVQSDDRGDFDEIAVGGWLHVERIDHRAFYVAVGEARWNVNIDTAGRVQFYALDKVPADVAGEGSKPAAGEGR